MLVDLRSGRVGVRTCRLADLEVLLETDQVGALPSAPSDNDARRAQLRTRIERGWDLSADGLSFFTVTLDGAPVGDIQARAPRYGFPPGVCEIGVSLVPAARGVGAGRSAVRLFSDYLLGDGWARVQGSTALDNVAMRRAFESAGFDFEGIAHGYLPDGNGGRIDSAVYARVAS